MEPFIETPIPESIKRQMQNLILVAYHKGKLQNLYTIDQSKQLPVGGLSLAGFYLKFWKGGNRSCSVITYRDILLILKNGQTFSDEGATTYTGIVTPTPPDH